MINSATYVKKYFLPFLISYIIQIQRATLEATDKKSVDVRSFHRASNDEDNASQITFGNNLNADKSPCSAHIFVSCLPSVTHKVITFTDKNDYNNANGFAGEKATVNTLNAQLPYEVANSYGNKEMEVLPFYLSQLPSVAGVPSTYLSHVTNNVEPNSNQLSTNQGQMSSLVASGFGDKEGQVLPVYQPQLSPIQANGLSYGQKVLPYSDYSQPPSTIGVSQPVSHLTNNQRPTGLRQMSSIPSKSLVANKFGNVGINMPSFYSSQMPIVGNILGQNAVNELPSDPSQLSSAVRRLSNSVQSNSNLPTDLQSINSDQNNNFGTDPQWSGLHPLINLGNSLSNAFTFKPPSLPIVKNLLFEPTMDHISRIAKANLNQSLINYAKKTTPLTSDYQGNAVKDSINVTENAELPFTILPVNGMFLLCIRYKNPSTKITDLIPVSAVTGSDQDTVKPVTDTQQPQLPSTEIPKFRKSADKYLKSFEDYDWTKTFRPDKHRPIQSFHSSYIPANRMTTTGPRSPQIAGYRPFGRVNPFYSSNFPTNRFMTGSQIASYQPYGRVNSFYSRYY